MSDKNGFHSGELAVQKCAGEAAIAARNISVLTDTVIAGARPFIAKQSMVVLSSIDRSGAVWASVLFGASGFLHTDTGATISIDVPLKERDPNDPLWTNIGHHTDLGMLFLELSSRRRYRVNGNVQRLDADGVEVQIREAYPNCPKYIQRRQLRKLGETRLPVSSACGTLLGGTAETIVRQADTLFVASRYADTGADASHRGGTPGFIQVVDESTLRIPDYVGNSLFNTLGNFSVDPRAGLCVIDFEHGQLLQLTGKAKVLWDQQGTADATGGTMRVWEFKVDAWILRDTPQELEWEYFDASPFNPSEKL
ncbi:pyridoxamine 5'-phosphate oxidase [Pseudoduganella sp. FT55W]|uniref:Pyridoxamine 5'-phosphate oxidase n=1 Tax=Duganella rivi TaxID=2666083 RepID=A0A7X4GMJ6_9BURK|nr:pyridoxamine 5'-phosphate oxidase family protein [Duganella rivi]MYM65716.1 pyridoxamine 5'-phosphate oxidase [Duganella rivi]